MKKFFIALMLCLVSIMSFEQNPIPEEPYVITSGGLVPTIKIGNQGWMKECIRVQTDSLGNILINNDETFYNGAEMVYQNNEYVIRNGNYYYNRETSKKVCPNGWKLPSNSDFVRLQMNIISDTTLYDWQNGYWLKALCDTTSWCENNISGSAGCQMSNNNQSNFSIVPRGYCTPSNTLPSSQYRYGISNVLSSTIADFWTSDGYVNITSESQQINYPNDGNNNYYFQVRCIKDTSYRPQLIIYDTIYRYDTITTIIYDTIYIHDTIYIYDTVTVEVGECLKSSTLKVYPNPSTGILTIENCNNGVLEIYNINGQAIRRIEKLLPSDIIDISDLPNGNYIFIIYDNKKMYNIKVVKQ